MSDKLCNICGKVNIDGANYCSACGASEFAELQETVPRQSDPNLGTMSTDGDIVIGSKRVVVLTVVTTGLYLLYWFYLTWKQLRSETEEEHFPVWHALTLLVPIYGLFRAHRHVSLIQELALKADVETSLSPKLTVVLLALNGILSLTSSGVYSLATIMMLEFISLTLIITVILWSQSALNGYWIRSRGVPLREIPLQTVEKALLVLGSFMWVMLLASIFSG